MWYITVGGHLEHIEVIAAGVTVTAVVASALVIVIVVFIIKRQQSGTVL